MNKEILRLLENLKKFAINNTISIDLLDTEFKAFAEDERLETISDLNDAIEDELSYWAEDGQDE